MGAPSTPAFTATNTGFCKKPVNVHALQWNGEADKSFIEDWVGSFGDDYKRWFPTNDAFVINTLESNGNLHTVSIGDFIIRGLKGEYYACKPEIFHLSYEKTEA